QHVAVVELFRGAGRDQVLVVEQAAGVAEQLAQRHLVGEGRQRGQPVADRIVELQFAVLRQQQDRGGGELLGDRGEAVVGGRRGGGVAFQVGHDVAAVEQALA